MRSLELALPNSFHVASPRTFKLVAAELETNDLRIMSSTVGCEPFGTFLYSIRVFYGYKSVDFYRFCLENDLF